MISLQQHELYLAGIIALLCIILFLILGSMLGQYLGRIRKQKSLKANRENGADGELRAKEYLEKHGFTIEKEQAYTECEMIVDGVPQKYQLRADFIVSKDGVRSVVDAKSGTVNVNPSSIATRRQLLEYFVCYEADNVYVYNSIENKLVSVTFAAAAPNKRKGIHTGYYLLIFLIVEMCIIAGLNFLR